MQVERLVPSMAMAAPEYQCLHCQQMELQLEDQAAEAADLRSQQMQDQEEMGDSQQVAVEEVVHLLIQLETLVQAVQAVQAQQLSQVIFNYDSGIRYHSK
jgi:hypothetical protein